MAPFPDLRATAACAAIGIDWTRPPVVKPHDGGYAAVHLAGGAVTVSGPIDRLIVAFDAAADALRALPAEEQTR